MLDIGLKGFVFLNASNLLSGNSSYSLEIFPFLHFTLAYLENKGMAWGMFAQFQNIILAVRIGVIGFLIYGLLLVESIKLRRFPFLLILFGAVGNVLDTFVYGYVIDMLHFTFFNRSYGVFNIADAMIFIGAILLLFKTEGEYGVKE
jgi:signal peptidase II